MEAEKDNSNLKSIKVHFGQFKYKHLVGETNVTFSNLKEKILTKLVELG